MADQEECEAGDVMMMFGAGLVALTLVIYLTSDYLDIPEKKVAAACMADGYWQLGQKRFICHEVIEEVK